MKVFISGHKGLVGSALLRSLPKDFDCIIADRNSLDLSDKYKTLQFLKKYKPDVVLVSAAKVGGITANNLNQRSFLTENLEIELSLINGAADAGIKNLIFLGSSCIYPRLASQPISESSLLTGALEPTNEGYALAKIAGIRLCQAVHDELGYNYFSLMPTNLYGPNDNFDLQTSHVPAAFLRRFHEAKVMQLKSLQIWGSGKPLREFMHVDDLASACWFLLNGEHGGQMFNVGSGYEVSILDFAKLVGNVVGYEGEIEVDLTKPDGSPRKLLDSSKLRNLGWQARIDLEDGLQSTFNWFVKAQKRGEVRGIEA